MTGRQTRLFIRGTVVILATVLVWLAVADHPAVWPARNVAQYRVLRWWQRVAGRPEIVATGTLWGRVVDLQGRPVASAWVLVSEWNGVTHHAQSDTDGQYVIEEIPAGVYRPVAGAAGFEDVIVGSPWWKVSIRAGTVTTANITLPLARPRPVTPGRNLALGKPVTLTCQQPLESVAIRRRVSFDNGGRPNQPTLFYLPVDAQGKLPLLLTVYPGPAELWECASLPLAAAGYAVLAIGPAYSFNLEADIDELERLVMFVRASQLPHTNGQRIAVLGGSYSGLHVLRLLQRDQNFEAALLLGPPTDLFDMRRRLEEGTYIPPYGLDQALIALGLPDRAPMRYWKYSGAYHLHPDFPPLALLHSRSDEVVPYQQTELLAARLAAVGIPHETYLFEGASHYLMDEQGGAPEIYEITLDFLRREVGN